MKFFDVDAMIGAHFAPREGKFPGVGDLLATMDRFEIDKALVYQGLAREYDIEIGNRQLLEDLQGQSRLYPCWVMGLYYLSRLPDPVTLVKELVAKQVKAVRFFWDGLLSDCLIPDITAYGELFSELEKYRIPCLMEYEGGGKLNAEQIRQIDEVLKTFTNLPVILTNPTFGVELRLLYARLKKYPNLYLETSGLMGNGVLEELVEKIGAGRLIFGTRYPWYNSGQVKIALAYAEITEAHRQMIAAENLELLIQGVRS